MSVEKIIERANTIYALKTGEQLDLGPKIRAVIFALCEEIEKLNSEINKKDS